MYRKVLIWQSFLKKKKSFEFSSKVNNKKSFFFCWCFKIHCWHNLIYIVLSGKKLKLHLNHIFNPRINPIGLRWAFFVQSYIQFLNFLAFTFEFKITLIRLKLYKTWELNFRFKKMYYSTFDVVAFKTGGILDHGSCIASVKPHHVITQNRGDCEINSVW